MPAPPVQPSALVRGTWGSRSAALSPPPKLPSPSALESAHFLPGTGGSFGSACLSPLAPVASAALQVPGDGDGRGGKLQSSGGFPSLVRLPLPLPLASRPGSVGGGGGVGGVGGGGGGGGAKPETGLASATGGALPSLAAPTSSLTPLAPLPRQRTPPVLVSSTGGVRMPITLHLSDDDDTEEADSSATANGRAPGAAAAAAAAGGAGAAAGGAGAAAGLGAAAGAAAPVPPLSAIRASLASSRGGPPMEAPLKTPGGALGGIPAWPLVSPLVGGSAGGLVSAGMSGGVGLASGAGGALNWGWGWPPTSAVAGGAAGSVNAVAMSLRRGSPLPASSPLAPRWSPLPLSPYQPFSPLAPEGPPPALAKERESW